MVLLSRIPWISRSSRYLQLFEALHPLDLRPFRITLPNCKSLHTSLVAHTAGAYPGFRSIKQLGILLLLLDWMLVHRRLPPAFFQVSLTVRRYPFILLGGERHYCMRVKCFVQEHNPMTWPGLELGPLDPDSSALTTRPPRSPPYLTVRYSISSTRRRREV